MTSSKNMNEHGYDAWSEFYDQYSNPTVAIDELHFPAFYSDLRDSLVLEIGCRTGRHTHRLVANGNSVVGIDPSEGMLSKARRMLQNADALLLKGDFLVKDLGPTQFDAALACLVLEHIRELDSFFAKLASSLKAGGKFYLSEIHPERTAAGIFAHFKNSAGETVSLLSHAHAELDIRQSAQRNGFKVMKCETVVGGEQLVPLNENWARFIGMPMIQMWLMEKLG